MIPNDAGTAEQFVTVAALLSSVCSFSYIFNALYWCAGQESSLSQGNAEFCERSERQNHARTHAR